MNISHTVAASPLLVLLALSLMPLVAFAQPTEPQATHKYPASRPMADRYIVIFKAHVQQPEQEAQALMRGSKGQVHHTFTHALKGFSATIPEAALKGLKNNPNIESIEPDLSVQLNQTSPQNQAPWGLRKTRRGGSSNCRNTADSDTIHSKTHDGGLCR
jgi:hypothetical protein